MNMAAKKNPTHIFIVESHKLYVDMLDYIFSKDFSYRFVNFKSGEECLENMHLNPDVILLDFSLPGINGYDTLKKIKERHPEVFVLVLISDKDDKLPSELFEAGADDYILKESMNREQITEKVEAFLNRDRLVKTVHMKKSASVLKPVYFVLLALLALSAGIYYYN